LDVFAYIIVMQKLTREQIQQIYDIGPEAIIQLIEKLFKAIDANKHSAQQVASLRARVNELEKQIAQNSHNSHKPPSSDGLKKQVRSLRQKSKNKSGGQKGHKGHTLKQVAKPDKVIECSVDHCTTCGKSLADTTVIGVDKRQVFDIPPISIEVTEYQAEIKTCSHCNTTNKASFPKAVTQPVQYGCRIKAQAIYLMNQHLLPYQRTAEILFDFYGQQISTGTLYNINHDCYQVLKQPVENIKEQVIASDVVHFDESGLRVDKKTNWLHSSSTSLWSYYMFHKKRGSAAMDEANILPRFKGIAVHDHWKPYFKYTCRHALCNAHHLRELIFIFEHDKQKWAKQMIELFLEIKQSVEKAKSNGAQNLARSEIENFQKRYNEIIDHGLKMNPDYDPKRKKKKKTKAQNLLHRLEKFCEQTLAFMYDFRVPFDNNLAERDIRMIKVQQKISGCFRSDQGAEMFCRIRSYISSAKKQGYNILCTIQAAIEYENIFLINMAE
jgi:transposase